MYVCAHTYINIIYITISVYKHYSYIVVFYFYFCDTFLRHITYISITKPNTTLLQVLFYIHLCPLQKLGVERSVSIIYNVCCNIFIYCSWSSLFAPVDSSYHLMWFPYSSATFLPSTFFVLLLPDIFLCVLGSIIQSHTLKNSFAF